MKSPAQSLGHFLYALSVWAGLGASSSEALAEAPEIFGLNDKAISSLKRTMPEAFDGPLSLSEIDDLIRSITLMGDFEKVFAEKTDSGFRIEATPTRYIADVTFRGQSAFSKSQLLKVSSIESGQRFERNRVIEAGERINNLYSEGGFYRTIVTVNFNKKKDNKIGIEFEIQELEPCRILDIQIQSDDEDLSNRLAHLNSRQLKKPLTSSRLQQIRTDLSQFLIRNQFLTAEISEPEIRYNDQKTEAFLVYRIADPYRYEFYIDPALTPGSNDKPGLSFSRQEIYRAMGIERQESRSQDPAGEMSDRLRQFYYGKGYPAIQVVAKVAEEKNTFVRKVKMEINEGKRVRVDEMQITGRLSRPEAYYREFILDGPYPNLSGGLFNRIELEKALDDLINKLKGEGFLQAQVRSSRVEYPEQSDRARIVVVLDEGPLTQVLAVKFNGVAQFKEAHLLEILNIQVGGPLKLGSIDEALGRLVTFYRSQGYMEMKVLNEGEGLINYNERGTQASLNFDIQEGPRCKVSRVLIEGLEFTDESVVQRSVAIRENDIITPEILDAAETRLTQLGIFNRVAIRTLEEGSMVADRTLVISLTEKDPGEFRLGVGANNERGLTLRGFTSYSYDNLGGTARSITLSGEAKSHVVLANYPQYELAASYLEPFLFDSQVRGRVNVSVSSRIFEFQSADNVTKIQDINRFDLLAERFFRKNWRLTWKVWGMDGRKEFERYGRCLQSGFAPEASCPPITLQVATLGPTIDYDTTDNRLNPTKGFYSTWNLNYSSPAFGSSDLVHFFKSEWTATQVLQIKGPRLLWVNSVRAGYLTNLSQETGSGVPTSYAFFLGGPFTVRGFNLANDADRIPNQRELPVQRGNQLLIGRDSYQGVFKTELRFGLWGDVGGVLFYDGGIVQVTGIEFDRPWRDAVGLGLRYNTPVGPLAIDIGFKINPITDKDPQEAPYIIHFSFGTF